jgi:DNA-binding NarL/FixJ family response regulator
MAHGNNRGNEIRIIVVHISKIFRDLLTWRLSQVGDFKVVCEAGSVKDARSVIAKANPDVVLMGLTLPDGSGIDVAHELANECPSVKWILLASRLSADNLAIAISTGLSGCVFESCTVEDLVGALKEVAAGGYAYDTGVLVNIVRECAQRGMPHETSKYTQSNYHLSPRQQEILGLVSRGLTNKEIANAAYLSVNTVKTHLRRIYQELGVNSRREIMHDLNVSMN